MKGVVYVACTNVGRAIVQSHLKNHPKIPILALINLSYDQAKDKANFDAMDDICIENKINIIRCQNINDDVVFEALSMLDPDLIIQSGWSQKFSNKLLALPRFGCIGEHPSPLPVGRGAACVNWAIIDGYKSWGDSFFRMTSVYDVGDVLSVDIFEISDSDTCKTVYDKVALSAYRTIARHLPNWVEGHFSPISLDESTATYYKKRRPKDGVFSFRETARSIVAKINATTRPYPGARFIYRNTEIYVWKASLSGVVDKSLMPGSISLLSNLCIAVVCGDGNCVILEEVSSSMIPPAPPVVFFELLLNSPHADFGKLCFGQ